MYEGESGTQTGSIFPARRTTKNKAAAVTTKHAELLNCFERKEFPILAVFSTSISEPLLMSRYYARIDTIVQRGPQTEYDVMPGGELPPPT